MRAPPLTPARRVLYGLIVASCLVGLTEIGLRLSGVGPAYRPDEMGQWQTTPGLKERRMRGSREPHDFVLSTNMDGLRTQVPTVRTTGVRRVALMGDSNVFGWGLDDTQTLAAQTELALRARGHEVEIINAGQPGYSTAQAAWLFGQVLSAYTPDLTVVFLSMHDHNRVLVSDKEVWQGPSGPSARLRVLLAEHSRIYTRIRAAIHSQSTKAQLMPHDPGQEDRVPRVSDAERGILVGDMATQAATWGGQVTLGLMPDISDLRSAAAQGLAPRLGEAWARAFTEEAGTPFVSLRACCPEGGEALVFPFDHGHMNAAGNVAAAQALAAALDAYLQ